ncbi:hypothetical protein Pmani_028975 [Petrolisthes manimaculis]|uniref:Uncharacterized protein n=1 Tax=Petrolisthes manimaculis TaxID=1843537 RepID=A0AAE1NZN0_9EUCA|nr:hypothetical protein Pmani_028975 [Petrolisthes manimaculis]
MEEGQETKSRPTKGRNSKFWSFTGKAAKDHIKKDEPTQGVTTRSMATNKNKMAAKQLNDKDQKTIIQPKTDTKAKRGPKTKG